MEPVEGSYKSEGNVKSFQATPPSPAGDTAKPAAEPNQNRVGGRVTKLQIGADGSSTVTRTVRGAPTPQKVGPPSEHGVVVTGALGSPISLAQAKPGDRVDIPGFGDTSVQVATSLGLLRALPGGMGYELVNAPAADAKTAADAKEKKDAEAAALKDDGEVSMQGVEPTHPALDLVHKQLRESAGAAVYGGALQAYITGGDPTAAVAEIARRSGKPEAEIREAADGVFQTYDKTARQISKAQGVRNHEALVAWVETEMPDAGLSAMKALVEKHDAAPLARLSKQYLRLGRFDFSNQELLGAQLGNGITAREVDGKVMLKLPGHAEMSAEMAHKAGLIRFSGGR